MDLSYLSTGLINPSPSNIPACKIFLTTCEMSIFLAHKIKVNFDSLDNLLSLSTRTILTLALSILFFKTPEVYPSSLTA